MNEPYLVYLKDKKQPFAFAGVFDEWLDTTTGLAHHNLAIITCPPNQLMGKIEHHRMPVILPEEFYNEYLNLDATLSDINTLLQSYPVK